MAMNSPMVIIAGDGRQAEHLARYILRLPSKDYRIVRDGFDVMPLPNGSPVWLYGTYFKRRDWQELEDIARARGLTMLKVEEQL